MRIYAATETFSAALKRKKSVGGGRGEERREKKKRKTERNLEEATALPPNDFEKNERFYANEGEDSS
jgi:hypothetical protein